MTDDTDGRYDEDDQQVPSALAYAEERAADAYAAWRDTSADGRVPTWEQLDPFVRRCMIGQEADRMASAARPGAVAAAPPSDEGRIDDDFLTAAYGPPAGHEDEAAVERAARAGYTEWARVFPRTVWDALHPRTREEWRVVARAALAAARGPRPVEDEAAVERRLFRTEPGQVAWEIDVEPHSAGEDGRAWEKGVGTPAEAQAALRRIADEVGGWIVTAAASRGPRTPNPGADA